MTKEELEKEAEEKAFSYAQLIPCSPYMEKRHREIDFKEGYFAGAESREKQIQIDVEQIRALQKQNGELTDKVKEFEAQIEKMSETLLDLLWFEDNLDPYMYECNDAQKGELLKPFDKARFYLEKYRCKKCKGEGTIKVGYNGWTTNPCPDCEGKGYILRR